MKPLHGSRSSGSGTNAISPKILAGHKHSKQGHTMVPKGTSLPLRHTWKKSNSYLLGYIIWGMFKIKSSYLSHRTKVYRHYFWNKAKYGISLKQLSIRAGGA